MKNPLKCEGECMKLLVMSDSHGASINVIRALRLHSDADVAIFLGDGAADFLERKDAYPNIAFLAVSGNCDIGVGAAYGLSASEQITLEGKRIFYTHGHVYGVKGGVGAFVSAARSRGADIALFGHTHQPLERYIPADEEGSALYLVNPGSIGGRGSDGKCSYAVITIRDGDILVSHGKV